MDQDADTIEPSEMARLEADFIGAAARFASYYAISADAWIDVGVSAVLIQRAGLDR